MAKKAKKSKVAKKARKSPRKRICSNCGTENPHNATTCKECQKTRFEPEWVVAKRPLNRMFSVQITKSNPDFGESVNRITLSKWWPGGRATFHIPRAAQWQEVVDIIDNDLAPILGWNKAKELVAQAKARGKSTKKEKKNLKSLVAEQPDFLKSVVEAVDLEKLGKTDFNALVETLGEISDVVTNANSGFRNAFLSVVKKLPKQKQRALEDLDLLLKGWSLHVITNVAQQVRGRIETIELFENQINNDRTYEIIGNNSIHRILERAMWLVDERYWLLFSNKTLLTSIGKEMAKRDKKRYGNKRPDFVCGTVGNKLIILELKRPSHKLKVDDLNQLESYILVAESYFQFTSYEAYLVGSKIDPDLKKTMKHRSRSFKILTYSELIDQTKKRYSEYLNAVSSEVQSGAV